MGITAPILRLVVEEDVDAAVAYFENLAECLANEMLLQGCRRPSDLRRVPLIFSGETRNYLDCRGYNLTEICRARRQK